ncbi:TetR/AcrR family transcriptional regulator [Actinoplanes sp. CA-252034]|uniref:TetR/AcrR family transcriptional regulator n=1 Tax=Actinoplanes sp. CA-252034 TaxID=3239906 RepID=UPI003D9542FC
MGLRDEKKQATRTAIADAALALFLEKGFDRVTVAEVARAATVSVNTVFNYFPTKEDLFFDRQDEVVQRLARAVRGRTDGETAATAVHRAFLQRLDHDDPTLGLQPGAERFWRVVDESPALMARARLLRELTETALADALADAPPPDDHMAAAPPSDTLPPDALPSGDRMAAGPPSDTLPPGDRMAAALIAAADHALHAEIRERVAGGESPAGIRSAVRALAGRAFAALDVLG